jgi:methyl coenzyme M reductase gamma subunit
MSLDSKTWRDSIGHIVMCANTLSQYDLDGLIAAGQRADSIGAIVDPTLYRSKAHAMREDLAMLEAARTFVRALSPSLSSPEGEGGT